MQAIEVSHLIKKFGSLTAVNDISFSVGEGENFVFLGPNVPVKLLPFVF